MSFQDTFIAVTGRVPWHAVDAPGDPRVAGPESQRKSGADGYEVISENGRPTVRYIRDGCFRGLTRYESVQYHDLTKDHSSDVGRMVVCTKRSGAGGGTSGDDPVFVPMTEVLFGAGASISASANRMALSGADGEQVVTLSNLADPSADSDAATKNYVDSRTVVDKVLAGSNIALSPAIGTGDVTIGVTTAPTFSGAVLAESDLEVRGNTAVCNLTASATVLADAFVAVSDARLKGGISRMDERTALAQVRMLRPCTYEMRGTPGVVRAGLIAQDVLKHIPSCVQRTGQRIGGVDHALGVNYTDVVAFLVAALGALADDVSELQQHKADGKD
jgi:hypothetical protein